MPRIAKELSALEVRRLKHSGDPMTPSVSSVGGVAGLMLQITGNGGRSWLLRTTIHQRRREMGLGPYPEVTLKQAREKAAEIKAQIRLGIDPVEARRAAIAATKAAQRRSLSFSEACNRYLDAKWPLKTDSRQRQIIGSRLRTYAIPELGDLLVSEIVVQDVLRALKPIWTEKGDTAKRVRGYIESVFSWATAAGHRVGDNPARWVGNLKELLPAQPKSGNHHPALQLCHASIWFGALRQRTGIGAKALEFLALTAARSGEVRGATWDEIDLPASLWIIPATRMKAKTEHRVPLSDAVTELLKQLPRYSDNPLVFPAARGGQMSDMTLSAVMRRIHKDSATTGFIDSASKRPAVVHGLRSTFRDWASEQGFPREMAELALAHKVGSEVERAYRRTDMLERRRLMMRQWARYLSGANTIENTVALPGMISG